MSSTAERWRAASGAMLVAASCGLAAVAPAARAETLGEIQVKLAAARSADITLFNMEAGLAAFKAGDLESARRYLDEALAAIESVFSDSEAAAKARSLWYAESVKDFKGEPYERAMAYYYRGLIYLIDGDYGNARACFRSALNHSGLADEVAYRSRFAVFHFLVGWTNQLMGDAEPARKSYAEVARLRPDWKVQPTDRSVLVLADLGGAPRKVGDGVGLHEIVYRPAKRMPEKWVTLAINGTPARMFKMDDVFYEAVHRGPRMIDRIIDGKVEFKAEFDDTAEAAGEVGTAATSVSIVASGLGSNSMTGAVGGVVALSAIASLIASNVNSQADVRYWNNLPESIHLSVVNPEDVVGPAAFFDDRGQPVNLPQSARQEWTDPQGRRLIWIKSRD